MDKLGSYFSELWVKLRRKRPMSGQLETPLKRCLTTLDITLLGVGHMVGAGIYVLTGSVTRDIAGPAIILCFIIAAVVSLLSALCFAEFAARFPRAGSTYVYTYIAIGEFWAFVVGWNMILDMMVGMAAVARAWSGYVNGLTGGIIHNSTTAAEDTGGHAPWTQTLDFLAAGVVIAFSLLQAIGVQASANINSVFAMINIFVMAFVGLYGLSFADPSNWNDFAPYGAAGVLAGSASCFFAFIGLDSISIASEEAKDPAYSVPRATFYALLIVTVGYLLLTTTLTLMVPYQLINVTDALPAAFQYHGVEWARYLVSTAALVGMSSVIYGSIYTAPRYGYAMANDGLLFSMLAKVSKRTQVPITATFLMGTLSAIMALFFDISQLVEFLSMGTLIGYSMVAMAVLFLRYRPTLLNGDGTVTRDCIGGELRPSCQFLDPMVQRLPYGLVPDSCVVGFTIFSLLFGLTLAHSQPNTLSSIVMLALLVSGMILSVLVLLAFEQTVPGTFAVPLCPLVPIVSIAFNATLLSGLQPGTWARFSLWMSVGLAVYFLYGLRHSRASDTQSEKLLSSDTTDPSKWYQANQIRPNRTDLNGFDTNRTDLNGFNTNRTDLNGFDTNRTDLNGLDTTRSGSPVPLTLDDGDSDGERSEPLARKTSQDADTLPGLTTQQAYRTAY